MSDIAAWTLAAAILLPFLCIGGTAAYYHLRYGDWIRVGRYFDRGLRSRT